MQPKQLQLQPEETEEEGGREKAALISLVEVMHQIINVSFNTNFKLIALDHLMISKLG